MPYEFECNQMEDYLDDQMKAMHQAGKIRHITLTVDTYTGLI